MIGFLTVAIGSPCYYQYAANLIQSIRKFSDLPVCVLHDGNRQYKRILQPDYAIKIPVRQYTPDGIFNPFYFKTKLFDYTPFLKTIYIDADSLLMKPIDIPDSPYIQSFSSYPDKVDENRLYTWWGEPKDIIKHNKLTWLPQLYSGFMVFDRGEESRKLFETANKAYLDKSQPFREWRGNIMPDEYAFNVAWAKTFTDLPPHRNDAFVPSTGGALTYPQVFKDYSVVTANGGDNSYGKTLYYQNAFINQYPYPLIKKDEAILDLSKN
jgi:hypothetical protein